MDDIQRACVSLSQELLRAALESDVHRRAGLIHTVLDSVEILQRTTRRSSENKIRNEAHRCIIEGCKNTVIYDDEPTCYSHSKDSGSHIPGYSYKASQSR